jgi:hypothetical protein
MLDTIENVYQQTTARIFKIMIKARGTLPVIAFCFLDEEDSDPAYALYFSQQSTEQLDVLIDEKKRQLHANCRDLLWVAPHTSNEEGIISHRVSFLHRTVIDFLQTKHMDVLLSTRAGESFTTSLCMMYLAMLKTHVFHRQKAIETTHSLTLGVVFYARVSEREYEIVEEAVLDELHAFTANFCPGFSWQVLSGTYDCNNWLSYMVPAGLQLCLGRKPPAPP